MAVRVYKKLSIEDFGSHLLDSNDLDPIYVALVGCELPTEQMHRWLLAYWCFYHAGVASYLSERTGDDFFSAMEVAARNEEPAPTGDRWPRAKERRHFRGGQAIKAVRSLQAQYGSSPEDMVTHCIGPEDARLCKDVIRRSKEHYLFGDWIAFKVADMIDRCLRVEIGFDQAAAFMFRDPTESALMFWRKQKKMPPETMPRDTQAVITEVVEYLTQYFKTSMAPPFMDRPIGLQEVETILCKWKSHLHGHYPLFNDQEEILQGLSSWTAHSETAERFALAMPRKAFSSAAPPRRVT